MRSGSFIIFPRICAFRRPDRLPAPVLRGQGKKDFRYIQGVAENWAKEGSDTRAESATTAKCRNGRHCRNGKKRAPVCRGADRKGLTGKRKDLPCRHTEKDCRLFEPRTALTSLNRTVTILTPSRMNFWVFPPPACPGTASQRPPRDNRNNRDNSSTVHPGGATAFHEPQDPLGAGQRLTDCD